MSRCTCSPTAAASELVSSMWMSTSRVTHVCARGEVAPVAVVCGPVGRTCVAECALRRTSKDT
eukprot:9794207-Alexandrium_andersonii.AAC.1